MLYCIQIKLRQKHPFDKILWTRESLQPHIYFCHNTGSCSGRRCWRQGHSDTSRSVGYLVWFRWTESLATTCTCRLTPSSELSEIVLFSFLDGSRLMLLKKIVTTSGSWPGLHFAMSKRRKISDVAYSRPPSVKPKKINKL